MGKDTFELAGQQWPKVTWYKMKGMRFVYLTLWAAMITSATNGKPSIPFYELFPLTVEYRIRWLIDEWTGSYGFLEQMWVFFLSQPGHF